MNTVFPAHSRFSRALVGLTFSAGLGGCSTDLKIDNARPRVTWVAVEAAEPGTAALTLWVQDLEGDSVDLQANWLAADGTRGEVELAPTSYGFIGVVTRDDFGDPHGAEHRVFWDLARVPAGTVTLEFEVDDRPFDSDPGDTYTSDAFDPRAGMLPPTAAHPQ